MEKKTELEVIKSRKETDRKSFLKKSIKKFINNTTIINRPVTDLDWSLSELHSNLNSLTIDELNEINEVIKTNNYEEIIDIINFTIKVA